MTCLGEQVLVSFWYLADARQCAAHVRYWHKADIGCCTTLSAFKSKADMTICGMSAFAVAIGGKADMTFCTAYVCF